MKWLIALASTGHVWLAIGSSVGIVTPALLSRRLLGIARWKIAVCTITGGIAAVLGGRLMCVGLHGFHGHVVTGGVHAGGMLIAGVGSYYVSCQLLALPIRRLLDVVALGMGAAIALARIGCVINGCCAPVPPYYIALGAALVPITYFRYETRSYDGQAFLMCCVVYSICGVVIEGLRRQTATIGGYPELQAVAYVMAVLVCVLWVRWALQDRQLGGVMVRATRRTRGSALGCYIVGIMVCLGGSASPAAAVSNSGKIPVLLFHSWNAADHAGLQNALNTIDGQGVKVIPLYWAVEWMLGLRDGSTLPAKCVALSFDDGYIGDWSDIGGQRSFIGILNDFRQTHPQQTSVHAAIFVIGSSIARKTWIQQGLEDDAWWISAQNSGVVEIYNHGADHDHNRVDDLNGDNVPDYPPGHCTLLDNELGGYVAVGASASGGKGADNFFRIDTYDEADKEVRKSAVVISGKIGGPYPDLFAYPYGHASSYMTNTYFPALMGEHQTKAAFVTGTGSLSSNYLTRSTNRWAVPRFQFGAGAPDGWTTEAQLLAILAGAS